MSASLVRRWLHSNQLDVPLPASGRTAERWTQLAALTERNVVAGRLAEAHLDAVAILHELGGAPPAPGQLWGVWAAEAPGAPLVATEASGTVYLDGVKQWCSGAGLCSHALVTASLSGSAGDTRGLFAIALDHAAVAPMPSTWSNAGMAESDTRAVRFTGAPAVAVGKLGDYLDRASFWYGAIGVAACWLGGARGVAEPLYRRAATNSRDPHALAHLGAVDAALAAGEAMLTSAATRIDGAALAAEEAELLARRVRAVIEDAAERAICRTGRALGPGPLCQNADHAQQVADLSIYIRQSHAEMDLAVLGRLAGKSRYANPLSESSLQKR